MTSIMLLDCFAKELFSLQDYLFLHFTILGIAVTLIAITTSLTKEVRQDLIWEYYLKTKPVFCYYTFILISFFLTIIFYLFNLGNLSGIILILLIISFVSTMIFIPYFLWTLRREWLYKKIIKEFKNEIKKKN